MRIYLSPVYTIVAILTRIKVEKLNFEKLLKWVTIMEILRYDGASMVALVLQKFLRKELLVKKIHLPVELPTFICM
jgi:hypothetical protein